MRGRPGGRVAPDVVTERPVPFGAEVELFLGRPAEPSFLADMDGDGDGTGDGRITPFVWMPAGTARFVLVAGGGTGPGVCGTGTAVTTGAIIGMGRKYL